ncbi:MAG: phosphatidate cytidylyltransferase [Mariprofundales bacterium]|nr:phosphatidate cytidylyltransferase [Mariprofundales bacterium]
MGSELLLRVVTASMLFVAALSWLFYAPDPWFQILLVLFAIVTTSELLVLVGVAPLRWFAMVTTAVWFYLMIGGSLAVALLILWVGWVALLLFFARNIDDLPSCFQSLALAGWMVVWLLFFVWMVLKLHNHPQGALFLSGACLAVWAADIAAYFVGRRWGRRKLAPAISPGKSIEGLQAGIVAGCVVATAFWHLMLGMGYALSLFLALVVTVAGVAGDLMESVVKRTVGAKDSGSLLPGHGGVLDRIDALLPSIPLAGMIWLRLVA